MTIDLTSDDLLAALEIKLGGRANALRLANNEVTLIDLARRWRCDAEGVIYITLPGHDGMAGKDEIVRIGANEVGTYAQGILLSSVYIPTKDVATEIAIIPGHLFARDSDRVTAKIRADAERRGFTKPGIDVIPRICRAFTKAEIKEMGLDWIVGMHDPFETSGDPDLLCASSHTGDCALSAASAWPGNGWDRSSGFAFVVPHVGA